MPLKYNPDDPKGHLKAIARKRCLDKTKIAQRRVQVAQMYLQGHTQRAIAQVTGVALQTIGHDLEIVRREWQEKAALSMDQRKDEELAKIDLLEREAWAAWDRSCLDAVTRTSRVERARQEGRGWFGRPRKIKELDPKTMKHRMVPTQVVNELTRKGQSGDPRFLDRVAWCIEMRLKVFGFLKPDQGRDGATVNINWFGLVGKEDTAATDPIKEKILEGLPIVSNVPALPESAPQPESTNEA